MKVTGRRLANNATRAGAWYSRVKKKLKKECSKASRTYLKREMVKEIFE